MSKQQQSSLPVCVKQAEHATPQNKSNMFYLVTTVIMLSSIFILVGFNVV